MMTLFRVAVRLIPLLTANLLLASCSSPEDAISGNSSVRSISAGSWDHYGGSVFGTRYVASSKITPANVANLEQAWIYRTGDAVPALHGKVSQFKATPILFADSLIFSTGLNKVHAIDPDSGQQRWVFNPGLDLTIEYSEQFTSRGVSSWSDSSAKEGDLCADRVFLGTLDARLIALDARTGNECKEFGRRGAIDLSGGANPSPFDRRFRKGEYAVTSPPLVANNVVVVGSSIGDNGKSNLESGVVRAFDARTGRELWRWDPIPRNASRAESESWQQESWRSSGAANVWTAMSADPALNLVYLPTTSPSPDFYGGERLGDNKSANSIVALDLTTGRRVWAHQTIKHDLWDYDLAAQPLLVDAVIAGERRSLLVHAGKTGFVHFLDRATGEPVFPSEQRAVPQSTVPGEQAATTQTFPALRLHPEPSNIPGIFNASEEHVDSCERMLSDVDYKGIFTPPSLTGTLLYPGNPGGVNWGSMAAAETDSLAFVVVNRWPTVVQLLPRRLYEDLAESGVARGVAASYTEQRGTPYGMVRFDVYNREVFSPCFEGPWSTLVAIDLTSGTKKWEVPAGVLPRFAEHPEAAHWGSPINQGGPIATDTGLVFLATRFDANLHAFDTVSGATVWSAELPAQPHATPMSYVHNERQYIVVAAGGWDSTRQDQRGDYVVAFRSGTE